VRLDPKHPPGRANRKARAYESEIVRLRAEGYTCEAIRVSLADIGVEVSLSTVQREAARREKRKPDIPATMTRLLTRVPTDERPVEHASATASPFAADKRSGREIAEAFVSKRYTNPLLRDRNNHESSRH
jgi:hypothetical protein